MALGKVWTEGMPGSKKKPLHVFLGFQGICSQCVLVGVAFVIGNLRVHFLCDYQVVGGIQNYSFVKLL